MALGKSSWWLGCREVRITCAAWGKGAWWGQTCCQCVLWEKKSQLVPNWGWFLAKPLAAVLRIFLLLLHLLLLDVVTVAIEPAASQAVAR